MTYKSKFFHENSTNYFDNNKKSKKPELSKA